jgi:hypothetical protein
MANIHATGENRALPLTILKRILGNLDPDRPVGILYDIGCSLNKYMASVCIPVVLRDVATTITDKFAPDSTLAGHPS